MPVEPPAWLRITGALTPEGRGQRSKEVVFTRAGWKPPAKNYQPRVGWEQAVAAVIAGDEQKAVAGRYQVHPSTLQAWLHRAGYKYLRAGRVWVPVRGIAEVERG